MRLLGLPPPGTMVTAGGDEDGGGGRDAAADILRRRRSHRHPERKHNTMVRVRGDEDEDQGTKSTLWSSIGKMQNLFLF